MSGHIAISSAKIFENVNNAEPEFNLNKSYLQYVSVTYNSITLYIIRCVQTCLKTDNAKGIFFVAKKIIYGHFLSE